MFVELLAAFLSLCAVALWLRWNHLRKWDHFPGPQASQALPLVGHAYLVGSNPIKTFLDMKQKYGNVFRLDLGPAPCVIIAGFEEANAAFKSEVR